MNYFSLPRSFLVVQAVEVPHAVLGAWVRLQSYATSDGVESPRLVGAHGWKEQRWTICCQASRADVETVVAHGLARWEGDDLLLEGFDSKGLAALEKKRGQGVHGRKGGAGKHRAKAGTLKANSALSNVNPGGNPMGSTDPYPHVSKGGDGIRRDGIRRDGTGGRGGDLRPSGGSPVPPPPVESGADPDPLDVIRSAYRQRHGTDPVWRAGDAEKYRPTIAAHDPDVLAKMWGDYLDRDGEGPRDTYWREKGWPLHIFVTQAIRVLQPSATKAVAERRAAQRAKQDERRRLDEEAQASAEREEAERAALDALPEHERAVKLAARELPAALGAALEGAAVSLDGDRLVLRMNAFQARRARDRCGEIEAALARHGERRTVVLETAA